MNQHDETVVAIHHYHAVESSEAEAWLYPYCYGWSVHATTQHEVVSHRSLCVERIQIIEGGKNAIMNDNTRAFSQSRCQVLENLDSVLVCPVMEYIPEVINICLDVLRIEEVAKFLSECLIVWERSY